MKIEIITCNSKYENGQCVGGYHEIHKINFLQNTNHIIATIDSIIKNNLLYGCDDTVLEEISVSCNNEKIKDEINNHYQGKYWNVKVIVEFMS